MVIRAIIFDLVGMFTVHFENTIQAIADIEVLLKDTST